MPISRFAVVAIAGVLIAGVLMMACSKADDAGSDSASLPCRGGVGGGFNLTENSEVAYTGQFTGGTTGNDSLHIGAVFIGKGSPGWEAGTNPTQVPMPTDSLADLGGGSLGYIWVAHNRRGNLASVHGQVVPLDSFNVALVDRVDTVGGPPIVTRKLKMKPAFALAPGVCAARGRGSELGWADSIRAALMRMPEVREFAQGR